MTGIAYHALLVKYIRHVGQCEHVDFVLDGCAEGSDVKWAPGEWDALVAAANEAEATREDADDA